MSIVPTFSLTASSTLSRSFAHLFRQNILESNGILDDMMTMQWFHYKNLLQFWSSIHMIGKGNVSVVNPGNNANASKWWRAIAQFAIVMQQFHCWAVYFQQCPLKGRLFYNGLRWMEIKFIWKHDGFVLEDLDLMSKANLHRPSFFCFYLLGQLNIKSKLVDFGCYL